MPKKTNAGVRAGVHAGVHAGHRDRLRERFKQTGFAGFADHEVLELLLYHGIPQRDTNPIAHELLLRYGSIAAVLEANVNDLAAVKGMTRTAAYLLSMMPGLYGRYQLSRKMENPVFTDSLAVGEYCKELFLGRTNEVLYVLCLDSANRLIHAIPMQEGTIDEAPVYTRLLIQTVLQQQAVAVILAHNHPGGIPSASLSDITSTLHTRSALSMINVKLLDHIIVAGDRYYSMNDMHQLDEVPIRKRRDKISIPPEAE